MRTRILLVGLLVLLGLAGSFGGVARGAAATAPGPTWGNAIEVPGSEALNSAGPAQVSSVSCATAGNCAAGGYYHDSSGSQAFVASETNGVWGDAIEVPGTAALNTNGNAVVNSVSCATAGNCAAGGFYYGSAGAQAFVVNETDGVWGDAIDVPGSAALNTGGGAQVLSISCATAGNCAAGGLYYDNTGGHPFVANETNGVWGDASQVTGSVAVNSRWNAQVNSVSCATPGNCAAVGYYSNGNYDYNGYDETQGFVVSETNGVWGDAIDVPVGSGGFTNVSSVSCAAAGNCVAGGTYAYADDGYADHGFVITETDGVWGDPAAVSSRARVTSVSCSTVGNCALGGSYVDSSYTQQAFVVNQTDGVWGNALKVSNSAPFTGSHGSQVVSISCATAGNCAAGGYYTDSSYRNHAFVVSETNGFWADAIEVPGSSDLNAGGGASVMSISCGTAGNCAAGGYYIDGFSRQQAFVVDSTQQVPTNSVTYDGNTADGGSAPVDGSSPHEDGTTVTVLGPGSLTKTGYSFTGWNTAADGTGTAYAPGDTFSMPANDVTLYAQWTLNVLAPGTTTCNGTYTGTAKNVFVPAGAVCTLTPGTHVTQDVTVASGGTLLAKGVTIDVSLFDSGTATVCSSRVRVDVRASAPSGPLELGGPDCNRGNKISHDVLIGRENNDLWVWRNNVGNTLRVSNGHGATDSIVGNGVGNLLVRDSGPVQVESNHANHGTLRCTRDNPLTGSGNTAAGTNTCPK